MKKQVILSPGKVIFKDVPKPTPSEKEVLIKIMRIGICGSDIHVYEGIHPNVIYPVTQGHEVSGIVEKVGNKVAEFKPGDKVTIQPQIVCGKCYSCTHGLYHICDDLKVMGFQAPGAAAEFMVLEEKYLIKLPQEMTFEEGAMIEPVAVACGALAKIDTLKEKNVLILGAGPIGNLVAQTAKALGARKTMITEISPYRRTIAKKVGIDFVFDPTKEDLDKIIAKKFGENKADIIVECVGSSQTIQQALEYSRKGAIILLVGVYNEKPRIDLNKIQNNELTVIGSLMYQKKHYQQAIELVEKKKIQLEPLMSKHFDLESFEIAYSYIEKKKSQCMKVFINVH